MVSKKKNKKTVATANRGFSTTSSAPKSKAAQHSDGSNLDLSGKSNGSLALQNALHNVEAQHANLEAPSLANLTPEQLEAELENSDLQLLVESSAEKSRRDSYRHVSRLHTERRLLRASSDHLTISSWLSEEILSTILSRIKMEAQDISPKAIVENKLRLETMSVNDLTIKLWTLKMTLDSLGFTGYRIDDVIKSLLSGEIPIKAEAQSTAKDTIWGLDEAIDRLALLSNLDELPDYHSHQTENPVREDHSEKIQHNCYHEKEIAGTHRLDATSIKPLEPSAEEPKQFSQCSTEHSTDTASDTSSSDDMDPDTHVDRYINLQRKLFARDPELTEVGLGKLKKRAGEPQRTFTNDPKSKELLRRIHKLESDILFDRDRAFQKWTDTRIVLLSEAAERRRSLAHPRPFNESPHCENKKPQPETESSSSPDSGHQDQSMDLDALFSTIQGESVALATDGNNVTKGTEETFIKIRDFGKWSGPSPKKVLEDVSKSRDPWCKVIYTTIQSPKFSNRCTVRVQWSKQQNIPALIELPGISSVTHNLEVSVEMKSISCPKKEQAEAYVSTAALFLAFSTFPKESKAYLRLPAVWRQLWAEFAEVRKAKVDADSRDELHKIRTLVEEARIKGLASTTLEASKSTRSARTTRDNVLAPTTVPYRGETSEEISDAWEAVSSSNSFQEMLEARARLPIWAFRQKILHEIDTNQAIILCGETGCGKSTQVPSFLLEHELSRGRPCKIYCTEPRRISAISLARRVSRELGDRSNEIGTSKSLVGFAVRLESRISSSTRLVYATTGIVMRMLESGNDLEEITHLIVDEVHERTIDSDFLLIVLRRLMSRRPTMRVILMSATVNAERISKYLKDAPIINIPGRTFPVETKYLEDAIELMDYANVRRVDMDRFGLDLEEEEGDDDNILENGRALQADDLIGYSTQTRNFLAELDEYRIDYALIMRLLETIAFSEHLENFSKAILVFMPGMAEIRRLNALLVGHERFATGWEIVLLHSTIATEDQERAFLVMPPGIRKIVVSTNIAETGITIPDITCVIDTGKHREMRFDERRQLSRLVDSFISQANAKQRRGRAGRVQNGICFHLFTRARHDKLMAEYQTPEMLRLSLQDLALRVKICNLGDIEQVLSEALDPPLAKNIKRAIDSLVAVKALTEHEELTTLGRQLARLPLDVYLGKLIILAATFRCLDAGLTIAAILASKSPFQVPVGLRAQADNARLAFKRGDSDLLTVYSIYCAWRKFCTTAGSSEHQFCRRHFISSQALSNIEDVKAQLATAIVESGLLHLDEAGRRHLYRNRWSSRSHNFVELPVESTVNSLQNSIVDSVIAWSFYPKLLVRDGKGYRNIANNKSISIFPTSVNKGVKHPPKFLSYYQIMQSSNKFYNAHETSAVDGFAIALACGDAEFKLYSGVIVIGGNHLRFSLKDWKHMVAMKELRARISEIVLSSYRVPASGMTVSQAWWFDVWQQAFTQHSLEE